jgi:two-component system, NtrC family, response regulator AtoC
MNKDVERQLDLPAGQKPSILTPAEAFPESAPARTITLRSLRAAAEIHAISQALEQTGWNRRRAAEMLSISYRGLLYKIRQHNITPPASRGLTPLEQR